MGKDFNSATISKSNDPSAVEQSTNSTIQITDAATLVTAIVARTEAMGIIVNLLNTFFSITQSKHESRFSDEEIKKIQEIINIETQRTNDLYDAVSQLAQQIPESDGEKGE